MGMQQAHKLLLQLNNNLTHTCIGFIHWQQ
jgi:hypothetical protein